MQFHPTALAGVDGTDGFLVTEAVRGEGAHLLDAAGRRFVDELAPRDEVARAVQREMDRTGARSVALDMRRVEATRFPNVVNALKQVGIDPERELVPVAPAAHYMMGGIASDLHGRATLPGLYAVGECSCTGLHGANRLASNSLSECFVFGARAARAAVADSGSPAGSGSGPGADGPEVEDVRDVEDARARSASISADSRAALWRYAGLERSGEGLGTLVADEHPLARLIARSALVREESRGAHQRSDFPHRDPRFDGRHVTLADRREPVLAAWS